MPCHRSYPTLLFLLALACAPWGRTAPATGDHNVLVESILCEDVDRQLILIRQLVSATNPIVGRTLTAWRRGGVFIYESPDQPDQRIPFLLDAVTDAESKAKGIAVATESPLTNAAGKTLTFAESDLTAVDTSSKLRRAIKTTLDLLALANPDVTMRRDALIKLGLEQNPDYLPFFEVMLPREKDSTVRRALAQSMAVTQLVSEKPEVCRAAIETLGEMRSIDVLQILKKLQADAAAKPGSLDAACTAAARKAVQQIETHMYWGDLVGTAFRGLSLSAVLLVAALGLAITFGLMGVINMAHGEMITVGAYSAFMTQTLFSRWFGESGGGFDTYFIAALFVSFGAAGLVGLILERSVIRFLYARPLESLLATWGVSLVLQQLFRSIFGAANVQVSSPSWLSGSFVHNDVLFAYNRVFVIGFAVVIVLLTYLLLTKTSVGLQIRAVMQNRSMAACMGVRTNRINMLTFAFGSGLAGVAGACLSQIGNVGPSLGQSHIIDCFMIVVLGGVGNLVGTVSASLGVGITDQILQPFLGAVLGKITVLLAIILFLQWKPAGLFATRSRSLEG